MTGRYPGSVRGNPRLTPLMMSSFSRLHESSLNRTADSGYQSSFASLTNSFTPSSDVSDSSSRLYCSTPVTEDSILPYTTSNLDPVLDTPVQSVSSSRASFTEDRVPLNRGTTALDQDSTECPNDVLSCLIRSRCTPSIQRILMYLGDEDLMRLCQVSDEYCGAVCDDQSCLKRLSKFLISTQQNGENRTTLSHNNDGRPYGGVLRPIQNVMPLTQSGVVWTVPSPLESVDMNSIPRQLQTLIGMTRTLSEHHCVTNCHTCRSLIAVRLHHPKLVECQRCSQRSGRKIGSSRPVTKAKLFATHRWEIAPLKNVFIFVYSPSFLSVLFFQFIWAPESHTARSFLFKENTLFVHWFLHCKLFSYCVLFCLYYI
jgi:hypothetical protein